MNKAHKLPRLSKSLLEKPQLITEEKFREIAEVLDNRKELLESFNKNESSLSEDYDTESNSNVGYLLIDGPITTKSTGWEALCGGTSYESLVNDMQEFVSQGVSTVVMLVDSGGGQAYKMMETARRIRKLADDNDIQLIGYVDGAAGSAAYGLLSVCHEIIANPEAEVGSVGVVVSLVNNSKKLEKEGIERTFITAGKSKVPYDKDGSFKEGFISDLQESVDSLYEKFTAHVAKFRTISVDSVKATEAKMLKADKALEVGFVDKLMEDIEFQAYLENKISDSGVNNQSNKEDVLMHKTTSDVAPELTAVLQEQLDAKALEANALLSEKEALLAQLEAYKQKEALQNIDNLAKQLSTDNTYLSDEVSKELATFLLGADEATNTLFNSVLSSAAESLNVAKDQNEQLKASHNETVAKLEAEMEDVRKNFATQEQTTVEGVVSTEALDVQTQLKQQLSKLKTK